LLVIILCRFDWVKFIDIDINDYTLKPDILQVNFIMETSTSSHPRKRVRTEATINNEDNANDYDETLFHYYTSRTEHTLKIANEQMSFEQKLDEEEEANTNRLCWTSIQGNDRRCVILTGFTTPEFIELLKLCENDIPVNIGRGKRSRFSPADKFLIVLCYLKHYETQAKLGENFGISKAQINV